MSNTIVRKPSSIVSSTQVKRKAVEHNDGRYIFSIQERTDNHLRDKVMGVGNEHDVMPWLAFGTLP